MSRRKRPKSLEPDKVTLRLNWFKNHPVWSIIILMAILLIAITKFGDSLVKLYNWGRWIQDRFVGISQNCTSVDTVFEDSLSNPGGIVGDTRPDTTSHIERIRPNDPALLLLRPYELRKAKGSSVSIGRCPVEPCFLLEFEGIREDDNEPFAEFVVIGFAGVGGPMSLGIGLNKGCGCTILSSTYDLSIEVVDESFAGLRLIAAVYKGTGQAGHTFIDEVSCP